MKYLEDLFTVEDIKNALKKHGGNITHTAKYLEVPRSTLRSYIDRTDELLLLIQSVKSEKKAQKFQDINRTERKTFREDARVDNASEEYTKAIYDLLKKIPPLQTKKYTLHKKTTCAGILHLSDLHFNEIVLDVLGNSYDWNIAGKRLQYFVQSAIRYFRVHRCNEIIFAMTGDLINSDRRLDELTSNAVNRAQATLLATRILAQAVKELNDAGFNITVVGVVGNESRIDKERAWGDFAATNNYDFMIHQNLELMFEKDKGVQFVNDQWKSAIVTVAKQEILFIHGDNDLASGSQEKFQKRVGQLAPTGKNIRYVLCGHVHAALISDMFARSSSMVGNNDYSKDKLGLYGRASQNIHMVWENGNINSVKIDLQVVPKGIKGYNVEKKLISYNAKSAKKAQETVVSFEVRI